MGGVRATAGAVTLVLFVGAGCAAQRPVKRKDFVFSIAGSGGMLRYTGPCNPCEAGPQAGLNVEFGHMLGSAEKVALLVDLSASEAWLDPGKIAHGYVGGGLAFWPARWLFLSGSVGVGVSSDPLSGEDTTGGLSGRLVGGINIAEGRGGTLDVWTGSTIGTYFEGDAFDLVVGLGVTTFFDFKPDPDAQQKSAPLLTH